MPKKSSYSERGFGALAGQTGGADRVVLEFCFFLFKEKEKEDLMKIAYLQNPATQEKMPQRPTGQTPKKPWFF